MLGTKLGRFSRVLVTSSCVPLISTSYSPIFMRKAKPLFLSTGFFSISFLFANFFPLLFVQGCFFRFFRRHPRLSLIPTLQYVMFPYKTSSELFSLAGFHFRIYIFLNRIW